MVLMRWLWVWRCHLPLSGFRGESGVAMGLDQSVFRTIAAVLLIMFGVILFSTILQEKFACQRFDNNRLRIFLVGAHLD